MVVPHEQSGHVNQGVMRLGITLRRVKLRYQCASSSNF